MSIYPVRMSTEFIVIHHSLTKDGQTVNWQAIRNYHKGLGWRDIGYHFGLEMINSQAEILVGRPLLATGAHVKEENMNHRSIGICIVGNFDVVRPSINQIEKLAPFLAHLCKVFMLTPDRVIGHRNFAPYKSCPGKAFDLASLKSLVGSIGVI